LLLAYEVYSNSCQYIFLFFLVEWNRQFIAFSIPK
jgi:hypothetical protein